MVRFGLSFVVGPLLAASALVASACAPQRAAPVRSEEVTDDDRFEENDSYEARAVLGCNAKHTLTARPADRDFFALDTQPGTKVSVEVHAHHGADLDLYVVDGPSLVSDVVAHATSRDGDEALAIIAPEAPLALVVEPYFDVEGGTASADRYDLLVTCGNAADPRAGSVSDLATAWAPLRAR